MANLEDMVRELKLGAAKLSITSDATRKKALEAISEALLENREAIKEANGLDLENARKAGISDAILHRLQFTDDKINAAVKGLKELVELPDPVGRIRERRELDPDFILEKRTFPIGVIAMIFEARPDALVQIAGLALRSGNAVVLKGGKEAQNSNRLLTEIIRKASVSIVGAEWILGIESHEDVDRILKVEIDFRMIARIMRIALPSGIENSVFHIGKILVSSTVASFGTASIAANAVFNALSTFANIPGSAIGMASVTVIGQCCGAREYDQASYYGKKLLGLTFLMMGVTCFVIFMLTPELAKLYNLSDAAYSLAVMTIRLNMFQTLLFWPPAFTIPNFLRAAGDAKYTMIVSIASMWIFRVMLSVILGVYLGMGFLGVCWGMFVDWYCRGIFFVTRFLKGKWKTKTVV